MRFRELTILGRVIATRARRVLRPYVLDLYPRGGRDPYDRMNVIGHHDEFIHRRRPAITTHRQEGQLHGLLYRRVIEYDRAFMCTDGDEISSRLAIVVCREADGAPVAAGL